MGLEYLGGNATPDPIDSQELPRQVSLRHTWRHDPAPAEVDWRIRIHPSQAEWWTLEGAGDGGWVDRPRSEVGSGTLGTAVEHRVVLESKQTLDKSRPATFQVRAEAADDTSTRHLSVRVTK